jgi:1-deoxy-D-xylulose-5-phosphate reductoisomerase
MKKNIAILGSTGSVGCQALEVIDTHPELYNVAVLTAGRNAQLLIEQARKFNPRVVVITDENGWIQVREALKASNIKVLGGSPALCEVAEMPEIDIVLAAIMGFAGLAPVISAIKAGKTIALANKEPLVVAGELIMDLVRKYNATLLPVDSEHSAIFQCLAGEKMASVEKIYITASGGPFRGKDLSYLEHVKPEDALKHPNWSMGKKITIDSASLMNKGLEVIEARWLFNLKPAQIEVIVHPQSIVHSMVQFRDGSIKAQLGTTDMKLPIQYAFGYPTRISNDFKKLDFLDYPGLDFYEPDVKTFRNLALAYAALDQGGIMPCVLNAANEVVVEAFLNHRISFIAMSDIIEEILMKTRQIERPDLDDYMFIDKQTRMLTAEIILKNQNL